MESPKDVKRSKSLSCGCGSENANVYEPQYSCQVGKKIHTIPYI